MTASPESPPEADTAPAEPEYQQSPEDERLWRSHVEYVRRTVLALQLAVGTSQRALPSARRELQELIKVDCGADCCTGHPDQLDAHHELDVADRALRHVERIAASLLAQVEKVAES